MDEAIDPVAPGELLEEEFLEPMGITKSDWRRKSAYRRRASARSCRASAP